MDCAAVSMTCSSQQTYSVGCCMLLGMLHAAGTCLQVEKVKKAVETAKSMRSDLFLEGQCCCPGYKCCAFRPCLFQIPISASIDTTFHMCTDVARMTSKVHVQWLSHTSHAHTLPVTRQSCTHYPCCLSHGCHWVIPYEFIC